jgi:cyclase
MKGNSMNKKIFIRIGIGLLAVLLVAGIKFYPSIQFMLHKEIVQLDPTLTVVLGGGGNSGIIVGDSAVVVIDTKMMGNSEELYKLAKEKAGQRPKIVVNTHYHPDHVRGNKFFKGSKIYIGNYEKEFLQENIEPENLPTDVVKDSLTIDLGNEQVHLYNLGQAHTLNDVVVYLPNHNVLFTGDLIFNRVNPVLKDESRAKVSQWIHVLDIILSKWGNSQIIPGHGKIGDKEMVISMRQYFRDMTTAAMDPSKEKKLIEPYKDWMTLPNMSSPEKSIEYIKMSEMKK